MSNKKGDIGLEISVLKTLLNKEVSEEIKSKIVGTLRKDFFGFDASRDVWELIFREYIENGKKVPSLKIVSKHPDLSPESKVFLKKDKYEHFTTLEDTEEACRHLKDYNRRRKIAKLTEEVYEKLQGGESVDKVIAKIDEAIFELKSGDRKNEDFAVGGVDKDMSTKKLLKSLLDTKKDLLRPTGFKQLDKLLGGGCEDGSLIVFSANTGGGKSATVNNLLKYVYSVNHDNVAMINLEMKNKEVYQRFMSNVSGVPFGKIKSKTMNDKERNRLKETWADIESVGPKHNCHYILWSPTEDVDIHGALAPLTGRGLKWVIIDYINLLAEYEEGLSEAQSLGKIARYAKRWAQANSCNVVLLTQLDEKTLNIRYSRAIKEHANVWVWWVYGEEEREQGFCDWNLGKSRSSELGNFPMKMDLGYMRVKDMDREEASKLPGEDDDRPKKKKLKKTNGGGREEKTEERHSMMDDF